MTTEYARHALVVSQSYHMVCLCDPKGEEVSESGDYERHVSEAIEAALLRDLLEQFPRHGLLSFKALMEAKLAALEEAQ